MTVNFDRVSDIYDMTRAMPAEMEKAVLRQIVEEGELFPGSGVLEMGVGTGRIALPLVKTLNLKYVGIDISGKMMARLREKATNAIHLVRADVRRHPFRNYTFDAVLAVHILHLVPEWKKALIEAKRVLKPEGVMLIAGEGGNRLMSLDMLTGEMPPGFIKRAGEIAEKLGMKERRVGMVGLGEAVEALTALGASITLPPTIEHRMDLSLHILIALIAGRAFSALWDVPQETLDSCVNDLKNLFMECFGSLNKQIPFYRRFEMVRAIF